MPPLLPLSSSPFLLIRPCLIFRPLSSTSSPFSSMNSTGSGSGFGWRGRHPDEHVVNRTDEKDVQSAPAQAGMREKDRHASGGGNGDAASAGKEDTNSQGITERDHADSNKRAKSEIDPKAPGPVIGMNDERGGKGH